MNDESMVVVLPTLKYGYRDTPMTWEEVTDVIATGQLDRLTRSRAQQYDYEVNKQRIRREWVSIHDYILCTKFGLACEESSSGKCAATQPQQSSTTALQLVRNDFPYCLEDSIEHWILWKLGTEPCTPAEIEQAQEQLRNSQKVLDVLHWVNPPHLQSLPDIDHVHILIRCRQH